MEKNKDQKELVIQDNVPVSIDQYQDMDSEELEMLKQIGYFEEDGVAKRTDIDNDDIEILEKYGVELEDDFEKDKVYYKVYNYILDNKRNAITIAASIMICVFAIYSFASYNPYIKQIKNRIKSIDLKCIEVGSQILKTRKSKMKYNMLLSGRYEVVEIKEKDLSYFSEVLEEYKKEYTSFYSESPEKIKSFFDKKEKQIAHISKTIQEYNRKILSILEENKSRIKSIQLEIDINKYLITLNQRLFRIKNEIEIVNHSFNEFRNNYSKMVYRDYPENIEEYMKSVKQDIRTLENNKYAINKQLSISQIEQAKNLKLDISDIYKRCAKNIKKSKMDIVKYSSIFKKRKENIALRELAYRNIEIYEKNLRIIDKNIKFCIDANSKYKIKSSIENEKYDAKKVSDIISEIRNSIVSDQSDKIREHVSRLKSIDINDIVIRSYNKREMSKLKIDIAKEEKNKAISRQIKKNISKYKTISLYISRNIQLSQKNIDSIYNKSKVIDDINQILDNISRIKSKNVKINSNLRRVIPLVLSGKNKEAASLVSKKKIEEAYHLKNKVDATYKQSAKILSKYNMIVLEEEKDISKRKEAAKRDKFYKSLQVIISDIEKIRKELFVFGSEYKIKESKISEQLLSISNYFLSFNSDSSLKIDNNILYKANDALSYLKRVKLDIYSKQKYKIQKIEYYNLISKMKLYNDFIKEKKNILISQIKKSKAYNYLDGYIKVNKNTSHVINELGSSIELIKESLEEIEEYKKSANINKSISMLKELDQSMLSRDMINNIINENKKILSENKILMEDSSKREKVKKENEKQIIIDDYKKSFSVTYEWFKQIKRTGKYNNKINIIYEMILDLNILFIEKSLDKSKLTSYINSKYKYINSYRDKEKKEFTLEFLSTGRIDIELKSTDKIDILQAISDAEDKIKKILSVVQMYVEEKIHE